MACYKCKIDKERIAALFAKQEVEIAAKKEVDAKKAEETTEMVTPSVEEQIEEVKPKRTRKTKGE